MPPAALIASFAWFKTESGVLSGYEITTALSGKAIPRASATMNARREKIANLMLMTWICRDLRRGHLVKVAIGSKVSREVSVQFEVIIQWRATEYSGRKRRATLNSQYLSPAKFRSCDRAVIPFVLIVLYSFCTVTTYRGSASSYDGAYE